tara:strand:+ start:15976 stop:16191 length:216 start_codon:yes stop_codon:yes gene_type:complete
MGYTVKVKTREVEDDNFDDETCWEPAIDGGYGCIIKEYTPALQRVTVDYDVTESEYEDIKSQDGFIEEISE